MADLNERNSRSQTLMWFGHSIRMEEERKSGTYGSPDQWGRTEEEDTGIKVEQLRGGCLNR